MARCDAAHPTAADCSARWHALAASVNAAWDAWNDAATPAEKAKAREHWEIATEVMTEFEARVRRGGRN